MITITVSNDTWLEASNIADGTFAPLSGFLKKGDYQSCVNKMTLSSGEVWPIPISLDIPLEFKKDIEKESFILLINDDKEQIAEVKIEDLFTVEAKEDVKKIFGTDDTNHPGVKQELSRSPLRVGGELKLVKKEDSLFPQYALSPKETRELFKQKGWRTITGFQTRNPAHRAHEHLQRIALNVTDGLFIQPLIGWKKSDDFSPKAVIAGYETLIKEFYPDKHVLMGSLRTPMRYAGPREALFHALIRRNHGCTHFIVGRDHAGVGNYYEKYAAQELCCSFDNLGIEILPLSGPYFCNKCTEVVTDKTCKHGDRYVEHVSGTKMRALLSSGKRPPEAFLRKEISDTLLELAAKGELFVGERNEL